MRFLLAFLLFSTTAFGAQTYNCKFTSQHIFTATQTSALAINANSDRRCLILTQTGTGAPNTYPVFFNFGSAHGDSASTRGFYLKTGERFEFQNPPIGSVYIMSGASTQTVEILEGE